MFSCQHRTFFSRTLNAVKQNFSRTILKISGTASIRILSSPVSQHSANDCSISQCTYVLSNHTLCHAFLDKIFQHDLHADLHQPPALHENHYYNRYTDLLHALVDNHPRKALPHDHQNYFRTVLDVGKEGARYLSFWLQVIRCSLNIIHTLFQCVRSGVFSL